MLKFVDNLMHLRCTIVLTAAIILAGTDVSAATSVKPIQAGDVPVKRLLRSETSVDFNGEERGNYIVSGMEDASQKLLESMPSPISSTMANDAKSLDDLKQYFEKMAKGKDLHELPRNYVDEFADMMTQYNSMHSDIKETYSSILREHFGIIYLMISIDKYQFKTVQKALFNQWIKHGMHLKDVKELEDVRKLISSHKIQDVKKLFDPQKPEDVKKLEHVKMFENVRKRIDSQKLEDGKKFKDTTKVGDVKKLEDVAQNNQKEWTELYATLINDKMKRLNEKLTRLNVDLIKFNSDLKKLKPIRFFKWSSWKTLMNNKEKTMTDIATKEKELEWLQKLIDPA